MRVRFQAQKQVIFLHLLNFYPAVSLLLSASRFSYHAHVRIALGVRRSISVYMYSPQI